MFSVITNIYNKKTKGPNLMEFFTDTGKLKKFFLFFTTRDVRCVHHGWHGTRGELSYLAPLGSENISAPYFKQCFFRGGGGITPPDRVKHHASQSQDRNNKYFILYIEFCINNKI